MPSSLTDILNKLFLSFLIISSIWPPYLVNFNELFTKFTITCMILLLSEKIFIYCSINFELIINLIYFEALADEYKNSVSLSMSLKFSQSH